MRFNVAGLVKSPTGATLHADVDDSLELDEQVAELVEPLRGRLRLVRDHAGVLVEGRLTAHVAMPCARCLAPARARVELEVSEHFRPTVAIPGASPILRDPDEEDEPATRIDDKHVMDLTEVIGQTLITSLPLTLLCRPDCRGLCPSCGAALDTQVCDCAPAPDPRWDALRAIIDEQQARTDERPA